MNTSQQNQWKDTILTEILCAISRHAPLNKALIFKGARILSLHLGTGRKSLDIDANLLGVFQSQMPERDQQSSWFESEFNTALRNHFELQEPVRYALISVKIEKRPAQDQHPHGWDGFLAKFNITDHKLFNNRGLPTLELDLAAPEVLGDNAVCELALNGTTIQAYALHRIAGEKLRAFLSSLPAYRNKISKRPRGVRVKDLHDLAMILNAHPITETDFWENAAHEFQLACKSRFVDCTCAETFYENWSTTESAYLTDKTLSAVPWENAKTALGVILEYFEYEKVFPLDFPL